MKKIIAILFFFFLSLDVFAGCTGQSTYSACVHPLGFDMGQLAGAYPDRDFSTDNTGCAFNDTQGIQPINICYHEKCHAPEIWHGTGDATGACGPADCPAGEEMLVAVVDGKAKLVCTTHGTGEGGGETPPDNNCPNGSNPDGSCYPTLPEPDDHCAQGEEMVGTLNGHAVCAKTCADPNQSYGAFNGIEGCYGSPTCPNGGSFGYFNHVPGCYGGGSSGGGSTGGGSTGGGDTGGGDTGGGDTGGGDTGGGDNGGTDENGDPILIPDTGGGSGGGGSSTPSGNPQGGGGGGNNSIGAQFSPTENCPAGYQKDGKFCVNPNGDCPTGYHALLMSAATNYFICVKNNTPPSSAASSTPSSRSSSSSSSRSAASSSVSSVSGGGTGTSTGSGGSGSGTGTGTGTEEQGGACDPKAANYIDCVTGGAKSMPEHMKTDSGKKTVADVNNAFRDRLNNSTVVKSFSRMKNIIQLGTPSCPAFSMNLEAFNKTVSTTIHCDLWTLIKPILSLIINGVWIIIGFKIFASA
jgi:hypothetical protein